MSNTKSLVSPKQVLHEREKMLKALKTATRTLTGKRLAADIRSRTIEYINDSLTKAFRNDIKRTSQDIWQDDIDRAIGHTVPSHMLEDIIKQYERLGWVIEDQQPAPNRPSCYEFTLPDV